MIKESNIGKYLSSIIESGVAPKSMLSSGIDTTLKAFRTPVSKLTNKQKAIGALGTLGGIAAGKHILGDSVGEMIRSIHAFRDFSELQGYAESLARPLGEDTQHYLKDILRQKAELESGFSGIAKPFFDNANIAASKSRVGEVEAALDSIMQRARSAKQTARAGNEAMVLGKNYFSTSDSLASGVQSNVPFYGAYHDFMDSLSTLAKRDALRNNTEIRSLIDDMVSKSPGVADLESLIASGKGNITDSLKYLEDQKKVYEELGIPSRRNVFTPDLDILAKDYTGGSTLPRGGVKLNLTDTGIGGEVSRLRKGLDDLGVKRDNFTQQVKDKILSNEGLNTSKIRQDSGRLIDYIVNSSRKNLSAWNDYANRVGQGELWAVSPERYTEADGLIGKTREIAKGSVGGATQDIVTDQITDQIAKRLAAKAITSVGSSAAGTAVKGAFGTGQFIGRGINRAIGGETDLIKLLDSMGYDLSRASDTLERVSRPTYDNLAETYGKELKDAINKAVREYGERAERTERFRSKF